MLPDKDLLWLACSPDGVALIDLSKTGFTFSATATTSLQIVSVEIKTSIAASSLSRALNHAGIDVSCVEVGDQECSNRIPREHIGQLLQQTVVLHVNYGIYVSCSKTAFLGCTLVRATDLLLEACKSCLEKSRTSSRMGV